MKPLFVSRHGPHWYSRKVGGTHPFTLNKGWPWDEGQWFVQWWAQGYRMAWRIHWQRWYGFRAPIASGSGGIWSLMLGWLCITRVDFSRFNHRPPTGEEQP